LIFYKSCEILIRQPTFRHKTSVGKPGLQSRLKRASVRPGLPAGYNFADHQHLLKRLLPLLYHFPPLLFGDSQANQPSTKRD
jgi:hypothetical protein